MNIKYGLMHPKETAVYLLSKCHFLRDEQYIAIKYFVLFGKTINLNQPKSFNEKLQWLKLYYHDPKYPALVDKLLVRDYVASIIGEQYLIPLIGVWNSVDEIDIGELPNRFVMKCTHDSSSIVICENKKQFDFEKAKQKLLKKMDRNMFWWGREWPYKNLTPKIICEEFMEDSSIGELRDYKFFCFNGNVKCYKVDFDRFTDHHANYYDMNNRIMSVEEVVCPSKPNANIMIPSTIGEMKRLAEKLSAGMPFVRVDFYSVNNKVYFGEMTFFPAAGFGPFRPNSWDCVFGDWLELPNGDF